MTLGAAEIRADRLGWHIARRPGPDLAAVLHARPVDEVATLLPRLFNICRRAQGQAARLALGLPPEPGIEEAVAEEIERDHRARLFVTLRTAFGLPPMPPPDTDTAAPLPTDPAGLDLWLQGDHPQAELARAILRDFPGRCCTAPRLPAAADPPLEGAYENGPAMRQAGHPLLRSVEDRLGRGPLWRYLGLLADLQAARAGHLPRARRLPDGTAVVQAARGSYALRIGLAQGRVATLWRLTPTDHQLAPGGALDHALRDIPPDRPDLARRLVALHDPCIPVTVTEAPDA